MKLTCILALLLGIYACKHTDPVQPASNNLTGNWSGTYDTQQVGACSWTGAASLTATATWQVVDKTVTGTMTRQYGQVSIPTQLSGTISGSTIQVSETKANNVNCNGIDRTYVSHYEGNVSGNTLHLTSMDTLCPDQNCIFRRTLNLTRK